MRVLIAYDGSDCADAAIDGLGRAGLPADADVLVLSVAETHPRVPPKPVANDAEPPLVRLARDMADRARDAARQLAERGATRARSLGQPWRVETRACGDSPGAGIVRTAEDWNADLIVVGSTGRSGVARLLLGSVSQSVVTHARCSVRVVRRPRDAAGSSGPLKLLIGIDGSPASAAAVAAVAQRSWPAETEVRVVAAVGTPVALALAATAGGPETIPMDLTPDEAEHRWAEQAVRESARELTDAGLRAAGLVRTGDARQVLLDEADTSGADSLFVGATGLTRLERLLIGSVSATVAARARCSVEVVRSGA